MFRDRTVLWDVIQHLSSNSLKRFHMEKRIRSTEFRLHGCYCIRKLANNLSEPQRSLLWMPLTEPSLFGKANESLALYFLGHLSSCHRHGPKTSANWWPTTLPQSNHILLHFNNLQLLWSSRRVTGPNSSLISSQLRSEIPASATSSQPARWRLSSIPPWQAQIYQSTAWADTVGWPTETLMFPSSLTAHSGKMIQIISTHIPIFLIVKTTH